MLDREHACLAHLYAGLRRTEQLVLLLHYSEGLSTLEIADVLDLHADTVDVLLGRIRVLARRLLNDGQTAPLAARVVMPHPAGGLVRNGLAGAKQMAMA